MASFSEVRFPIARKQSGSLTRLSKFSHRFVRMPRALETCVFGKGRTHEEREM